MDSPA
jgi:hypothetical protein